MIAVIFEVKPHPEHKQNYLDMAAKMRDQIDKIDGFMSVERFQSLTDPNKLLSLSMFRDEAAVQEWRNLNAHRIAQTKGRNEYFFDYRLRVVSVLRDYGMFERDEAPKDSREVHSNVHSATTAR